MKSLDSNLYIVIEPDFSWREDANCKGKNPEVFMSSKKEDIKIAKAICSGCIVVKECLNFALDNDEKGIWGKTTEKDRKAIKRNLNANLSVKLGGVSTLS